MLSSISKFPVKLALALMTGLGLACAGQSERTPSAAMGREQALYTEIRIGIQSYEAGHYHSASTHFDRILASLTPSDSQLAFLGLYYGMRSRLAVGQAGAADSLFEAVSHRVPQNQLPELEITLGRGAMPGEEQNEICHKIGVILPLSGQYADFGQAILEGVKLAVDGYNQGRAETARVRFEALDDQSDPLVTTSLGRQLAQDSSVAALLGSYRNEPSLSLGLVASNSGLPLVCPTADAPSLAELGPLVHAINRTDAEEAFSLASYAVRDLGLQIFAVLAPETEKGALLAENFIQGVRRTGGAVVSHQKYTTASSNFDSQMILLQRYLPDAIYIPAEPTDITQLASQVHYYGLGPARLLGTEEWRSERVLRMGGEYVDGTLFASSFHEKAEALRWDEFKDLYERTFRRPVNKYSALGYDAASLILEAAEEFPVSRRELATELNRISGFRGAYGQYSIRANGEVQRETYILKIEGGEVHPAGAAYPSNNGGTAP